MQWKYVQLLKMSWHWHISTINTSTQYAQVCWPILTQHRQHTIKDRNSNIIKSWVGVYSVQEVPVESSPSSSSRMDHIPARWYTSRTPRAGWVMKWNTTRRLSSCRIAMLNCWDVSIVDYSSWRVVLVRLHTWDSNPHKSMANLISRHILDLLILD